jgi:serine phosphatase RsbU (regulator of sigma subunit)
MLPVQQTPELKKRRVPAAFVAWIASVATVFLLGKLEDLLDHFHIQSGALTFFSFLSWLVVCALTLYGFAIAVRWVLRRLFWTVGRRLFLSYIMIGVLPFFLFAILLITILYVVAGVASDANFKAERQTSIGQLENWASEYALQGKKPRAIEDSIKIFDSNDDSGAQIPKWLRESNFSGMTLRDDSLAQLTVARQIPSGDGTRSIVLTEPLDAKWSKGLEDRTGMMTVSSLATREGQNFEIGEGRRSRGSDFEDNDQVKEWFRGLTPARVPFFDITEEGGLIDWDSGTPRRHRRVFTLLSNPWSNLVHFYFGGSTSSGIMRAIFGLITGVATMLMIIYFFASAFAAVLIFSISRAVNRIERGTKAVERGDFSYRIRMKPQNQLGEMAQSFDRMTESIASLLTSVAEKERLQSEIEIAATIQRNLLPKEGPQFRGVSFSAHFEPTASIGGDYYDVFNLDKSRLAVAIGDVSGHGLSTGLVMAMVKAAITTLVEEGADERSLFQRLNELVYRSTERRAFMTLAFTIFDLERSKIRHTNAGHLYPYLLRASGGPPIAIESPSLPLGVRSEMLTRTVEIDLENGDTIVYLSDGIVEAQDMEGDPFGFDQLEALLATQSDRSPSTIRDMILDAVARHAGSRPADDDRTIMVLRFDNFATARVAAEPVIAEAMA